MKKLILLLFTFSIFCSSCSSDDDNNNSAPQEEYQMQEANDSGVSGSTFFARSSFSDENFFISIQLKGADLDGFYTAYLYNNLLSTGGEIALELDEFMSFEDADIILSSTTFHSTNQLIIGEEVLNYSDLIAFDGHIKIFNSNDLSTPIAQGNIGSNAQ